MHGLYFLYVDESGKSNRSGLRWNRRAYTIRCSRFFNDESAQHMT